MNCDWYEQQLTSDSIDLWPGGKPSPLLADHARTCSTCERLVQQEVGLRRQFVDLAFRNQACRPSPSVKSALLAELDLLHPASNPRRERILYCALAVAAVICLALALAVFRRTPVQPPAVADAPAETPAPPVASKTNTAPSPSATNVAQHKKPSHRPPSVSTPAPRNDFYPVVMCDSVTCAGPALTVRVQLPRSPLAAHGSNTPVMADLLVGEDGLVRGVRLLQ
jgi:hypothetical protein